jgi:hypothetical protein
MKKIFEEIISEIKSEKDIRMFDQFISNYTSREERHYCAYLFAWLISSPDVIKTYFNNHTVPANSTFPVLTDDDFKSAEVYYEYTALRELLNLIEIKGVKSDDKKAELKSAIEKSIFGFHINADQKETNNKGDIQKKKPDLVFFFPHSKSLVLVEAKFEMGFDDSQLEQSMNYGSVVKNLFPDGEKMGIKNVFVTALGIDYRLIGIKEKFASISWEKLHGIITNEKIKKEIERGLIYQAAIHPKAMKNLNIK